jgi:hypothetical protein
VLLYFACGERFFGLVFFAEHGIVFFFIMLSFLVFLSSESELNLISVLDHFLRGFCFFCLMASCAASLCHSDFVCTPEMSSLLFP